MDKSGYALTSLEDQLLSNRNELEIKKIHEILLLEENRIKKLKMKGCKPEEFDIYNKELKAISAGYKILEGFAGMEI